MQYKDVRKLTSEINLLLKNILKNKCIEHTLSIDTHVWEFLSVHTLPAHNCVALTLLWLQSQVYRIEERLNQYLILILSVLYVHCGM